MPASALPFIILAFSVFGGFAVVLSSVAIWAHAGDRKAKS